MLTEIICERFRGKKITFSNGLNVIIGDGSNSIGKSTLLWVIDFVFGGSGFTEKNKFAIQKITVRRINALSVSIPYFYSFPPAAAVSPHGGNSARRTGRPPCR